MAASPLEVAAGGGVCAPATGMNSTAAAARPAVRERQCEKLSMAIRLRLASESQDKAAALVRLQRGGGARAGMHTDERPAGLRENRHRSRVGVPPRDALGGQSARDHEYPRRP